jgi:hypothetical protein
VSYSASGHAPATSTQKIVTSVCHSNIIVGEATCQVSEYTYLSEQKTFTIRKKKQLAEKADL